VKDEVAKLDKELSTLKADVESLRNQLEQAEKDAGSKYK
jgi:predicted  nucleic acid-binding Zn-ribbon protein